MNDLIKRQDAIKYCYDLINAENPSDEHDHWNYSQERINQTEVILHHLEVMPSAQPTISILKNVEDAISRQKVIDALRNYLVEKRCPDDGTLTCRLIENEVINKLPSVQPERKTGRWIPVSERLPDKRGDYLVTLCGNGEPWVEIALWNETFGGRWQMVLYNDVDYSDISNVIAWMPLPKPYQEGEQE